MIGNGTRTTFGCLHKCQECAEYFDMIVTSSRPNSVTKSDKNSANRATHVVFCLKGSAT